VTQPPSLASVTYREASASDVPAITESRLDDPVSGSADPRMAAYLEGRHHPQHALLPRVAYLATAEALVVGYIAGHLTRRYACDGELQYLYVRPEYRRGGVASELVRLLGRWFSGQSARRICVNVEPDNAGGRAFYSRHGAVHMHPYWLVWSDISIVGGAA